MFADGRLIYKIGSRYQRDGMQRSAGGIRGYVSHSLLLNLLFTALMPLPPLFTHSLGMTSTHFSLSSALLRNSSGST